MSDQKEHRDETITDRMRKLRVEMGVDELPKLRIAQSQRPRSTVPRVGRKAAAERDG